MSEALVKSVNGKQGFVNLTTEDIPVVGDNQYMSTEDKLNLIKLESQTRDLRTHVYDDNLHVDKDILVQTKAGITHRFNEGAHLSKGMKKKLKDHLEKPHDGRRGIQGRRGFPGPPGSMIGGTSLKRTTRVTSSPYEILATDEEIFVNTDAKAITLNLPVGVNGKQYRIINTGTSGNNVTLNPNGAELLNGFNESEYMLDSEKFILTFETIEGWW